MGLNSDYFMCQEFLDEGRHFPKMNGKKVFVHAITRMVESIQEGLEANELAVEDIDMFFFHQANLRINMAVAEKLGIPGEKIFNTIQRYGNTTAATIPIGMHDALKAGKLKPGMKVACSAFGSGFTWGSTILTF
jgi:3-oxoacyl-[acyl-carrier-protein] synthase-3